MGLENHLWVFNFIINACRRRGRLRRGPSRCGGASFVFLPGRPPARRLMAAVRQIQWAPPPPPPLLPHPQARACSEFGAVKRGFYDDDFTTFMARTCSKMGGENDGVASQRSP